MEIKDAATATEIAQAFLKKNYSYGWPKKAVREDDVGMVEVDVGAFTTRIAKVKISAKDGTIIDYSVP